MSFANDVRELHRLVKANIDAGHGKQSMAKGQGFEGDAGFAHGGASHHSAETAIRSDVHSLVPVWCAVVRFASPTLIEGDADGSLNEEM